MTTKRTGARRAARYRIVAAEAHSWSSLLLEDERGQHYLYAVGTNALTKVSATAAGQLLAERAYRTWRGERSWTPLDQLPIHQHTAESPLEAAVVSASIHHGDIQPA